MEPEEHPSGTTLPDDVVNVFELVQHKGLFFSQIRNQSDIEKIGELESFLWSLLKKAEKQKKIINPNIEKSTERRKLKRTTDKSERNSEKNRERSSGELQRPEKHLEKGENGEKPEEIKRERTLDRKNESSLEKIETKKITAHEVLRSSFELKEKSPETQKDKKKPLKSTLDQPKKKKKLLSSRIRTSTSGKLPDLKSVIGTDMDTPASNIYEIFCVADVAQLPPKIDIKNDANMKALGSFATFLRALRKYKETKMSEYKKKSTVPVSFWVHAFHSELVNFTKERININHEEKKVKIAEDKDFFSYFLTKARIGTFVTSLTNYLSLKDELKHEEYMSVAVELLDFFKKFTLDPYSCLIGFSVNKKIISSINFSAPQEKKFARGSLLIIRLKRYILSAIKSIDGSSKSGQNFPPILGSSGNTSPSDEDFTNVFCRFSNIISNKVEVFVNIENSTTICVEPTDCFELTDELENDIANSDIKNLGKYIENPFDEFYRSLFFTEAQEAVRNYLIKDKQINLKLLSSKNILLSDSYELHTAREKLQSISKEVIPELENAILELVNLRLYEYLDKKFDLLFFPTLLLSCVELFQIPQQSVQTTFRGMTGRYNEVLDNLTLNKRDLLNGDRKNLLVKWWLTEIRKDIQKFLVKLNFSLEAVPKNYIDEPPSNLNLVKNNLVILRTILNRSNPSFDITPVIEELKERIYPEIDNFLLDSKSVLSAEFGCDVRDLDNKQLQELFANKSSSIEDPAVRTWIEDTIKDIHYLTEMKSLEDEEYARLNPNFHIVPVSGLVMSAVVRFENENRTVLELWDNKNDVLKESTAPIAKKTSSRDDVNSDNNSINSNNNNSNNNSNNNNSNSNSSSNNEDSDEGVACKEKGKIGDGNEVDEGTRSSESKSQKLGGSFSDDSSSEVDSNQKEDLKSSKTEEDESISEDAHDNTIEDESISDDNLLVHQSKEDFECNNNNDNDNDSDVYKNNESSNSDAENTTNNVNTTMNNSSVSNDNNGLEEDDSNNSNNTVYSTSPTSITIENKTINLFNRSSSAYFISNEPSLSSPPSDSIVETNVNDFLRAIMDGRIKVADHILENCAKTKKFDVNYVEQKLGWSPFLCAASERQYSLCKKLFKYYGSEMNVNVISKEGNSGLHYILRNRAENEKEAEIQIYLIKKLLSKGAEVNNANIWGETPLHSACYLGNYKAAVLLLNANANPNLVTRDVHETCLHYAVRSKSPQIISKLVEAGADVTAVSILGETPMDIASKMNSEVLTTALRQACLNSYK